MTAASTPGHDADRELRPVDYVVVDWPEGRPN